MESRWIWPFELLDKLGEGGMGVVYRARYVGNNRMVAVKLVPEEVGANPTLVSRFERELDVLKQLRHPHIVHCFGGVCESKQRFYAMELVEGGTLHGLLREVGKLPWETVVDYGLQMCAGLQCAHEKHVVHRDVKPGNFLITKAGKLKLSDFGLALVVSSQRITSAGKTLGTFHYMAPEQIRGKPPVSHKTDLYALGCVFFEMLTGTPPFDADSAAEVLHKHLKEEPPRISSLVPGCPIELESIVDDLLQKNPDLRPDSAQAVANRLRNITAAPSTMRNSMALTPIAPRAVVEDSVETSVSTSANGSFIPSSAPPKDSGRWPLIGTAAMVATLIGFALLWRSSASSSANEQLLREAFLRGPREARMAILQAAGEAGQLSPGMEQFFIEQLSSNDRETRLGVLGLMQRRPEIARPLVIKLGQMEKSEADAEVRQRIGPVVAAAKTAPRGNAWVASLIGWAIWAGIIAGLIAAGNYGWKWAKSHALIPGL